MAFTEKGATVPSGAVSVHLTWAFGVADPDIVKFVTPTVPLLGETDPVTAGLKTDASQISKKNGAFANSTTSGELWVLGRCDAIDCNVLTEIA
ncbi:MAG: hypothetical protein IPM28_09470 [Chloracidobacterium sp.]|nr:hypothetical protein [Chloracidobacterium sp.]